MKKTYNINSIRKEWIELQSKGGLNTPFQDFFYLKRTSKLLYPYYFRKKYMACFYCFYDDGVCVMIVPIAKYLNCRKAELLANVNGLNYCDVLVKNVKYIKPALAMLKSDYDVLMCNKVLDSSLLYLEMKESIGDDFILNNVCVNFDDDYERFNKSLSKSTRQNLRTAYNRINTDGRAMEFKTFRGGEMCARDYKQFIDLYIERHAYRYNLKTSRLKKWFLLNQSFATLNYIKNPNGMTAALYIDGKLSAFMSGLIGDKCEFVVPRLSINEEFSFYSPGMLLLNETIKYFMANTQVRHLDLSKGEEPYKYKMGGEKHLTHSFMIDLKKLKN
ncbi:MAG: GNAT family N-acetyltransferase [Prevotellaceae bacterium]|nr:GNAT family N-acetyltransferase [Candidatus Minthosoma caballi]